MLRLRAERKKLGLTLTEVSKRTGIAITTLSNLEQGKVHPWPKYRREISRALNIEDDILFAEVE